jgi:hypothetical protein
VKSINVPGISTKVVEVVEIRLLAVPNSDCVVPHVPLTAG